MWACQMLLAYGYKLQTSMYTYSLERSWYTSNLVYLDLLLLLLFAIKIPMVSTQFSYNIKVNGLRQIGIF